MVQTVSRPVRRRPATLLAVAVMLGAGSVASVSVAATWSDADCSQDIAGRVDDVTWRDLAIDPVDHVALEVENDVTPKAESEEKSTPLLFLSPRVASVMRDIFGDEKHLQSTEVEPEVDSTESDVDQNLMDVSEETVTAPVSQKDDVVPLIQQQMYRIDI